MIIFAHTLKRILRNKVYLLVMLLAPALMTGFIFGFAGAGGYLAVNLVDLDDTPLTRMLAEDLAKKSVVTFLEEEEQIRSALAGGRADYALVIEAGFTEAILHNDQPRLYGYSIRESNVSLPLKIRVESFISAARNIAAAAGGDRDLFYRGMEYYLGGSFALESYSLKEEEKDVSPARGGTGLLAMSMLFLATFATIFLLRDRENRTFYRVLASPATLRGYMLQNILSFLVVALLQVAGVFLVVRLVFGIYLGPSVPNLLAVMAVYALLCVSFAVGLAGVVRVPRQAGIIASLLITPMSMLGGLLWPREVMPVILQQIGRFMPTAWVMDAAQKVILGSPLANVSREMLIMFLYTLVFFLLGSWRRVDVAR